MGFDNESCTSFRALGTINNTTFAKDVSGTWYGMYVSKYVSVYGHHI